MAESIQSGVAAVGEIATGPVNFADYQTTGSQVSLLVFLEQLGRGRETCAQRKQELEEFFSSPLTESDSQIGASPHAPYSVGPTLLNQIVKLAAAKKRPVAMHLAETMAEREFVENLSGEFVSLLQDFGIWDPANYKDRASILETIEILGQASSSLVVHGNYLRDDELDQIASHSNRMSIAFCPRTHQYFGHTNYPLKKILTRNINLCVGTDSRASNPDLDLFRELQQIAKSFPGIGEQEVLGFGTINGAIALNVEGDFGSIEQGKSAAICYVEHPNSIQPISSLDWLFAEEATCVPLNCKP